MKHFEHSWSLVQGEGDAPCPVPLHNLRSISHVICQHVPFGLVSSTFFSIHFWAFCQRAPGGERERPWYGAFAKVKVTSRKASLRNAEGFQATMFGHQLLGLIFIIDFPPLVRSSSLGGAPGKDRLFGTNGHAEDYNSKTSETNSPGSPLLVIRAPVRWSHEVRKSIASHLDMATPWSIGWYMERP